MTRIKICGLTREEDIAAVNRLAPEYIGFVFWPYSKRALSDEQARLLKQKLDPAITAVGVFVDDDISHIRKLVDDRTIDAVQLHGSEDEEYIRALKKEISCPVIKAVRIKDGNIPAGAMMQDIDHILFDAGMGDGRSFDWNIILRSELDLASVFLAGGLDPENVREAVMKIHPFAVDVSSGVETGRFKDADKMEAFVRAVRSADTGGGQ